MSNQQAYRIELDLVLHFVPPMDEHSAGFVMTRTLHLPFPPYDGLAIHSTAIDDCPDPMGMILKDIVWDMDRNTFLATTRMVSHDLPIAFIPDTIREWKERGWKIGSYSNSYDTDNGTASHASVDSSPVLGRDEDAWFDRDDDEIDSWRKLPSRKRPARFNRIMRALVRMMAETYNSLEVAYAMDKTKRLFTEKEAEDWDAPGVDAWRDALLEFSRLTFEQKMDWKEQVEKRCPRLDRIL